MSLDNLVNGEKLSSFAKKFKGNIKEDLLGGKKLRYITQAEYDGLTDDEKNDDAIIWNIVDPDIVEYATKEYVDGAISNLDGFATEDFVAEYVDENQIARNNGSIAILTIPKADMDVMLEENESELIFPKVTYDEGRSYYIEYDGKVYNSTSVSKNYIEFNYYDGDGFYVELDNSYSNSSVMCFYYFKYYLGYVDPEDYEDEPPMPTTATDMVIKYDDVKYLDNNLLDENLQVKNSLSVGVRNGEIGGGSTVTGAGNQAGGTNSFAQGEGNKATGLSSSAMGSYTTAEAPYAHAEGYKTSAFGTASHVEGTGEFTPESLGLTKNSTIEDILSTWENSKFSLAKGEASHVEGKDNLALESGSHAEGSSSIASGENSHAEGCDTTASGISSHAEGDSTTASNYCSHAEGGSTTASNHYAHAEGCTTTASGISSHAEGSRTTASNYYSHAEGFYTTASGMASHTEGDHTIASSENQHVQGKYNIEDSAGTYAHIVGNGTSSSDRSNAHTLDWNGNAWFAGDITLGDDNIKVATENDALLKTAQSLTDAEKDQVRTNLGYIGRTGVVGTQHTVDGKTYTVEPNAEIFGDYVNNIAIGQWSICEGSENVAAGKASHCEGAMNKAIGMGTHVEGVMCEATGYWSHAEGEMTKVSSYASHAEGSYTNLPNGSQRYGTASGYASHVEGGGCHASGSCSHAEGLATDATANHSHAEGRYTIAAGAGQHVEGRGNIADTESRYIHIAGNGDWSDGAAEPVRSNAYTLDWDGNGWFAGTVKVGADNKELATKEYVSETIANETHSHENLEALERITDGSLNNYNTAYDHSQEDHAPSNAQKNSDITKTEIENKLTGTITSHSHNYLSPTTGVSASGGMTIVTLSQAEYDALSTKDSKTIYI